MKSRGRLLDIIKSYRLFWVICGALLLVNVLFYFVYISAESRKIGQLQTQFQAERKKVSELRKRQAEIDQFKSALKAWTAFEESLPGKIQFPERIQQLKQILSRYRLASDDLSFRSEPIKDENLVRFTTTFQTTGQYDDFKRFIAELQTMPGLFCIRRIELQQPGDDKPLEMEIDLAAYFRDDNRPSNQ
jgi:Tfp pilus assembly protein PilO